MLLLFFLLFIFIGYIIFPILFFFQKIFKLPVTDLTKTNFHVHHSFYGLILIVLGSIMTVLNNLDGLYLLAIGLGIMAHHEASEPGLEGINKFIYIKMK